MLEIASNYHYTTITNKRRTKKKTGSLNVWNHKLDVIAKWEGTCAHVKLIKQTKTPLTVRALSFVKMSEKWSKNWDSLFYNKNQKKKSEIILNAATSSWKKERRILYCHNCALYSLQILAHMWKANEWASEWMSGKQTMMMMMILLMF